MIKKKIEENFNKEKLKLEEENKKEIENIKNEKNKIEEEKNNIIESLKEEKSKIEEEKNNIIENLKKENNKLIEEKKQLEENFIKEKVKMEELKNNIIDNLNQEKTKLNAGNKELIESLNQEKLKLEEENKQIIQKLKEEKKKLEDNLNQVKNKFEEERTKFKNEKKQLVDKFNKEKSKLEEEKKQYIEKTNKEKMKTEENKENLELSKEVIENKNQEKKKNNNENEEKNKTIKKSDEKPKEKSKDNTKDTKSNIKNKSIGMDSEQSKLLIDIVSDYLFKLFNAQYYINIFDLISQSEKNFDTLDFFTQLNIFDNYSIDDYILKFFNNFQSYMCIKGEKGNLEDFITQKAFKYNQSKPDMGLLKKIMKINIGNEKNLIEIYKERREEYMKNLTVTFNLLKKKYEQSSTNTNMKGMEKPYFLTIEKSNLKQLTINMNEINLFKFNTLFKYQLKNIVSNLHELTVILSSPNILIIYDIIMNCEKLESLNLIGPYFDAQNNPGDNISLIGETIPKIITGLNKLTSFSIQYIPIELNIFNNLKNALMNSKITNLGLSYTKIPEKKFVEFSEYLKGNQTLTEINFSGHNCNIPTLLKNTIFLSDNNITSLSLSDNNLTENDIEIIANILSQFPKIKKLNISKNNLSQKSCIVLGAILNKSTTLEEINLSSCGITGETIAILLNNKGSSIFKNVSIDNNNIEDLGLLIFSQFIKNSSNLNIISLRNVNGSDMGFTQIISTILVSKSQIKEIHIDRNKLISEVIVNTIIQKKDIYIEKGIIFYVNASCVKNKEINCKCMQLVS